MDEKEHAKKQILNYTEEYSAISVLFEPGSITGEDEKEFCAVIQISDLEFRLDIGTDEYGNYPAIYLGNDIWELLTREMFWCELFFGALELLA